MEHVLLFNILGIMIPTDFHTFQRGRYTTNQMRLDQDLYILDTRDEPLKIAPIFYRGHQSMSPDLDSHSRMYIIIVGLYKCIHNYIELYRYRYCLSYIYRYIVVYHGISMGIPGSQNGGTVPYCWPYFVGTFPYIGLIYGRYLQSVGSWNGHWWYVFVHLGSLQPRCSYSDVPEWSHRRPSAQFDPQETSGHWKSEKT